MWGNYEKDTGNELLKGHTITKYDKQLLLYSINHLATIPIDLA